MDCRYLFKGSMDILPSFFSNFFLIVEFILRDSLGSDGKGLFYLSLNDFLILYFPILVFIFILLIVKFTYLFLIIKYCH
jgi:hypothetical protein